MRAVKHTLEEAVVSSQQRVNGVEPCTATFRIEGLTQIEPGLFEISGMPHGHIEYARIGTLLSEQGVDQRLADDAIEVMAEFIWTQSLARVLAKRIKIA